MMEYFPVISLILQALLLPLAAAAVKFIWRVDKRLSRLEWHIFEEPKMRREGDAQREPRAI